MRKNKGFTLAELLIVVAIIAVLVAIAIPIFRAQLEKTRRIVDVHNARSMLSVVGVAIIDGTIEFDDEDAVVWATFYTDNSRFRAKGNMTIHKTTQGGSDASKAFHDVLADSGLFLHGNWVGGTNQNGSSEKAVFVKARSTEDDGWSWYSIYVRGDGTYGIVSGTGIYDGETPPPVATGSTGIEKYIQGF